MMRKDDLKPREKGVHYQAQADGSMPAAFRPAPQRQRSFANVNPAAIRPAPQRQRSFANVNPSLLIKKLPENNAVFQFNKSYKDFCK